MISFRSHRKRKKLKFVAGNDGVVALIDLWIGVATNNPSGILSGWDSDDVEIEAGWEGERGKFTQALLDVGFLDSVDDCYILHDWEEHQAWVVGSEDRSLSASKNQLYRWCLKKINKKIERETFKDWYYGEYIFTKKSTVNDIVSAYASYTGRIRGVYEA